MTSEASDGLEISDRRTFLLRIVGVAYLVLVSTSLVSSLRSWDSDVDVSNGFLFSILVGVFFLWFAIKGMVAKRVWLTKEHLRVRGWRSEFLVPLRHLMSVSYSFPGYVSVKARSEVGDEVAFSFLAQQHWLPFRHLWSHPTAENLHKLAEGQQVDDLNWEGAARKRILSTRGYLYLLVGGLVFWGIGWFGITQSLYGGSDYRAVVLELTSDPYIRESLEGRGLWPVEPAFGASLNSRGGYFAFQKANNELSVDEIIERAKSTEKIWPVTSDRYGAAERNREFAVYFVKEGSERIAISQIVDNSRAVIFDRQSSPMAGPRK